MHKDWHRHYGQHGHSWSHHWSHGWRRHGWHPGWIAPLLGFLFIFLLFKAWFIWPLLIGLFFVLPALRRWGEACEGGDPDSQKRKHMPHPRFVDVWGANDDEEAAPPKRKNDDLIAGRRFIRTADGDTLEIV